MDNKLARIHNQLAKSFVSDYNQHKSVVRLLENILGDNEPILAAVVGRNANHWSAMLTLTDQRLIYLEADFLFHSSDDISLSAIHGVKLSSAPLLEGIILQTRAGEYRLTNVSIQSAEYFTKAVEQQISKLPAPESAKSTNPPSNNQETNPKLLSDKEHAFLEKHSSAIISFTARTGHINNTPVYYLFEQNTLFVLARSHETDLPKAGAVTFTVFDPGTLASLQVGGEILKISDPKIIARVWQQITNLAPQPNLQPALFDSSLGDYEVLAISITKVKSALS